jgi:hypothetical protein
MGDEAPASLANGDKDSAALDPSPKRPDGPALREKESSTLAPGQNGSAMPPEAPLPGASVDAVVDSPSAGGKTALASSAVDGLAASSEIALAAPEEAYRWRGGSDGGSDGYGFLVTAQVTTSSFLSFPSSPPESTPAFSFDNVKHS